MSILADHIISFWVCVKHNIELSVYVS